MLIENQIKPGWIILSLLFISIFVSLSAYGWCVDGHLRLSFTPQELLSAGGSNWIYSVDKGEWHRIIAGAFLHADLNHLLSNIIALIVVGTFLEGFVGTQWFLITFVLSAIGGIFLSLLFNSESIVAVGASGGIMGLLTTATILSSKIHIVSHKKFIFRRMFGPVLLTIIPSVPYWFFVLFSDSSVNSSIDHAGHLGGILVGAIIGLIMKLIWPPFEQKPYGGILISLTLIVVTFIIFASVAEGFRGLNFGIVNN